MFWFLWGFLGGLKSLLHSFTAAGPVAVVEVEAFALEDEGADAVLGGKKSVCKYSRNMGSRRLTCAFVAVRSACRGMM